MLVNGSISYILTRLVTCLSFKVNIAHHRLATIKHADRIIVVTEEGIEEQGRHQDLIQMGGVYSRLHEAQFGH
ncbi:hypothetical protein NST51_18865 [Bacillus sp. FSL R7-0229]|uniref:hypothetical protein n=1 Tax=Bacillus sp. FSL R7-0229 TaxID=2954562 RepID=UPI000DCA6BB7|nr:hypothetical protein DEJ56_01445 [Bacillus altitudinis]